MATTIWKGHLAFGLVSIPVRLNAAAREDTISFNQLHTCKSRINQQTICKTCNEVVEKGSLLRGYEYERGNYLVVSDDELAAMAPESSRILTIHSFVKLADVDPVYLNVSYYLMPDEAGGKPYALVVKAMQAEDMAGVGMLCMRQKEYPVLIRARQQELVLHTMFYGDEVRPVEGTGVLAEVSEKEVSLGRQLINAMAGEFEPHKNTHKDQLVAMLERKAAGEVVDGEGPVKQEPLPVMDLMAVLKASLVTNALR